MLRDVIACISEEITSYRMPVWAEGGRREKKAGELHGRESPLLDDKLHEKEPQSPSPSPPLKKKNAQLLLEVRRL